jgi:hypothetical protein
MSNTTVFWDTLTCIFLHIYLTPRWRILENKNIHSRRGLRIVLFLDYDE